jgi:Type II secretion system (T2SS), protein L
MPTILRVLTDGAAHAAADSPWALYNGNRLVQSGRGPASAWPEASTREAVLPASAVRLVHVVLPPMPADRIAQAVAFSLEDQLAGPAGGQHLAASKREGDGVDVAIVARSVIAPLARSFDRVIAEPAVAPKPAAGAWHWYRSGASGGFVRRHDGSAFATSAVDDAQLRAWSDDARVALVRVDAWRWDQDAAALGAAFDLLQGDYSRTPRIAPPALRTRMRWIFGLAVAALAIHIGATLVTWASLRYRDWQAQRDVVATARDAGVADASDAQQAAAALAVRHADARHRAGLTASSDALPILARAAPALSVLPPGTLKSATYAANTWTLDLGKVDAAVAANVERNLAAAGLTTLTATTPAGTRMRIGP